LLAGADADHLPALRVAHRVGLGVLDGDQAQHQVAPGVVVELSADHVLDVAPADRTVVAVLDEAHAEDLACFARGRLEVRIGLEHHEPAALLGSEDLVGAFLEAGSDDSIGDDALQVACRAHVDGIRECDEVAEGALGVGAPGAHVGESCGRELDAVDLVGARQIVGERAGHGGAGRRDVLERGRRGQPQSRARLAHELPGVERVEQVDERGVPVAKLHRCPSRLDGLGERKGLLGVAAVLQLHGSPSRLTRDRAA
jgi:hypothetical protein